MQVDHARTRVQVAVGALQDAETCHVTATLALGESKMVVDETARRAAAARSDLAKATATRAAAAGAEVAAQTNGNAKSLLAARVCYLCAAEAEAEAEAALAGATAAAAAAA
eukprot:6421067-Pyramimonas_sp.AAC.1